MSTSVASHIPVLSLPKFKTLGVYDGALAEVLEPGDDIPAEPTVEERLQAEFERGLAEGIERTRANYESILETERAEYTQLLEDERVRFDMRESANISVAIEGFVDIVEQRLSYSVAKLLQPFLKDRIVDQLVAAFAANLRQLTEDDLDKTIRLRGPETLVARVLDQVPALRDRIEVLHADEVELVALFDETIIETRLGQWLAQVDLVEKEVK